MAISMLKIRRPLGRLIFNMGIAIPGKTVFLIETAPCERCIPSQTARNAGSVSILFDGNINFHVFVFDRLNMLMYEESTYVSRNMIHVML